MAAWLNVLLFLGMLFWIRLLVGFLALGGGGYYLHEFFVNPEAICKVTAPGARRRVLEQLRSLAGERSFDRHWPHVVIQTRMADVCGLDSIHPEL